MVRWLVCGTRGRRRGGRRSGRCEVEQQLCTIMEPLCELVSAHGATNIKDLPGAWECRIDDTWYVACNGHDEEITVEPEGTMGADIPPYHFAVWYNGWLAGLFHPYGGVFAAGSGANEETFTEAVRAHIAASPQSSGAEGEE